MGEMKKSTKIVRDHNILHSIMEKLLIYFSQERDKNNE